MDILFIHGNSSSSNSFEKQKEAFPDAHYIDLYGHGSNLELITDFNSMIESAKIYCDKHLNNPLIIGHSLGTHVAIQIAESVKARGLVLLAPNVVSNPLNPETFLDEPLFSCYMMASPGEKLLEQFSKKLFNSEVPGWYFEDFKNSSPKVREGIAQAISTAKHGDDTEFLKKSPLFLLWVYLESQTQLIIQNSIKNSFIIIE